MNKRIAVLTWVADTSNYGSILQAYAMQEYLTSLGYDVEFLYYKSMLKDIEYPPQIVLYKRKAISRIKRFFKKKYVTDNRLIENARCCKEFVADHIHMTEAIHGRTGLEKYSNKYDVYICGSDQIWSLNNKENPAYYLSWVSADKVKIAYAPSIPMDYMNSRKENFLRGQIVNFRALSVREQSSAECLGKILGQDVVSVLDPTLLAGREFWTEFINKWPIVSAEKYIVCYLLGQRDFYERHIRHFEHLLGVKIIIIPTSCEAYKYGYELANGVDPILFLRLIRDAELVLTDSYHAAIFSMIFRKNLYIFERFNKNSKQSQNARIADLINKFGLKNRIIDEISSVINRVDFVDYDVFDQQYDRLRTASQKYLLQALQKER